MTLYVINNCIDFRAGQNQLVLKGSDIVAKLTYPAARCLEIMLEQHGKIVSHAELYQKVWEERGANTTPNTLYQNISLIRRALKEMIPDGDKLINTIPRRGFRIHFDAVVNKVKVSDIQPVVADIITRSQDIQMPAIPTGTYSHDKLNMNIGALLFSSIGKFMTSLSVLGQRSFRY
ncbi:winged helix-turn-helix domain-containing protein [Trabulsiella odontotermitis]|uniref:winged helix-turn-helix domain-containing protein n=1 Tax=Trabulsiella odontotermitis TaxID=379893 RepID=UPI0006BA1BC7|nr:winged helix-turn-helix domain-containing protein [Trabulsiella odontotermitis]